MKKQYEELPTSTLKKLANFADETMLYFRSETQQGLFLRQLEKLFNSAHSDWQREAKKEIEKVTRNTICTDDGDCEDLLKREEVLALPFLSQESEEVAQ